MDGRLSPYASDPTCHGCPAERPPDARDQGWRGPFCRSCYRRWLAAGRPDDGPPAPVLHLGPRADRLEDYALLRSRDYSVREAAARLGVAKRTAERYEADLRRAA